MFTIEQFGVQQGHKFYFLRNSFHPTKSNIQSSLNVTLRKLFSKEMVVAGMGSPQNTIEF